MDCFFNSDGTGQPEAKEEDRFQFDEAISVLSDGVPVPELEAGKIVIIEELEMKAIKVDALKIELRNRELVQVGRK